MSNWLGRLVGRKDGVPFNAAMQDVISVLFPGNQGHMIVSDARSAVDRSAWIMRAVSTVATRIGSLPWQLYKGDKAVEGQSAALTRPSPMQTGTEFIERIIAWQMLHGTGFVYVEKPAIKGITVLDADMIRIDQGGNIQYREIGFNGQPTERQLDKSNIVLFPNFSISGQLGLSELRPILDAANMDSNSKAVWNNQMASGGLLAGLFSSEVRLSAQELDAAKKSWEEKYGGVNKAGTIGFLGAGFKFQPLGISAADMKLLEVSNVTRNEIGTAFGVPGIFLGDMNSVDYSNAQTQEKILYSNVICPKADRLADRITTFLLPLLPGLKGLTFKFDYSKIDALQEDKLQRSQIDKVQLDSGIFTINEIRERDGYKKNAWGDTWWASAMLVPISNSDIAPPPEPVAPVVVAPVVPPEADSVSVAEPKGFKALHSPEARQLIGKSFLSRTAPQEKKFMQTTMGVFHKQEKRVIAWLDNQKALRVPDEIFDEVEMLAEWRPLFLAFGMASSEATAARYEWAVVDPSVIKRWIDSRGAKYSKYVNETSNNEIMNILASDRANGLSIPDMVNHIKGYFDVNAKSRAEAIARTQVIGANNYADVETYKANGVEKKEWLATGDDRTRDSHAAADGQVVGVNEPFIVGGSSLQYPGDPDGPAEEVVSCRCTEIPVI